MPWRLDITNISLELFTHIIELSVVDLKVRGYRLNIIEIVKHIHHSQNLFCVFSAYCDRSLGNKADLSITCI